MGESEGCVCMREREKEGERERGREKHIERGLFFHIVENSLPFAFLIIWKHLISVIVQNPWLKWGCEKL